MANENETVTIEIPAEDAPAPIEETTEVPNVDFESLYKTEKKRGKRLFIGGTAVGAVGMFFWIKKMQPGIKALKERKKAEKAEKKAKKKAEKEAKKSASEE